MKVALVAEWLDDWRGGAERSTLQFLHHLMDSGVDLHVYTRSRLSPTPSMCVHTVDLRSTPRSMQTSAFARQVEALIPDESFDIVHAITPCRVADIYQPRGGTVAESVERNLALIPASLRRVKRLANWFNLKQRLMLATERDLLGRDDGPMVVAISDYVVGQLRRHYGLADGRIRKVFNAVDVAVVAPNERARLREEVRREFGIAPDDCLVLTIAHNFRLKGVQRWMEALALLVQRGVRNVRSLVVGNGESRRWHRLATRLGVSNLITFTGSTDRIDALFYAGDVLVHPTYYDPCSRVVMEGMALGLVCITTRWDGAAELIRDGVNGFVLDDPSQVELLADRVALLRDASVRQTMVDARGDVIGLLSMARHAAEVLELYRDLAVSRVVGHSGRGTRGDSAVTQIDASGPA